MFTKTFLSAVVLIAALASANPIVKRQDSDVTCGSTVYYPASLQDAVKAGYQYLEDGTTVGSDKYPHVYNNYEGFDFPIDGPYYEFPIEKGYAYSSGSPGADRVIFNGDGTYAGSITHTGASGDDFVGCSDTS